MLLSFLIQTICDELSLLLGLKYKPKTLHLAIFNGCVYVTCLLCDPGEWLLNISLKDLVFVLAFL